MTFLMRSQLLFFRPSSRFMSKRTESGMGSWEGILGKRQRVSSNFVAQFRPLELLLECGLHTNEEGREEEREEIASGI